MGTYPAEPPHWNMPTPSGRRGGSECNSVRAGRGIGETSSYFQVPINAPKSPSVMVVQTFLIGRHYQTGSLAYQKANGVAEVMLSLHQLWLLLQ